MTSNVLNEVYAAHAAEVEAAWQAQSDDTVSRYRLKPGWFRESGLLALVEPVLDDALHEHPLHPSQGWETPCDHRADAVDPPYPWPCPHWDDDPFDHLHDLSPELALEILRHAPAGALSMDYSRFAPSAATLLRAVIRFPDRIRVHGTVVREGPLEGLRLTTVTVRDSSLFVAEPDVVPTALPGWIDELSPQDYADYLRSRQYCLEHGFTRPAWFTAMARYDLDARRSPDMEITQIDGETSLIANWA